MSYHVSVTCGLDICDHDESFVITNDNLDPVLANVGVSIKSWDEKQGMPLVGNIQAALARLVDVQAVIDGMPPEDQATLSYVSIGVLVLVRDAILAHRQRSTVVSVTSP